MKLLSDNWQKFEDFLAQKNLGLKTHFPDIDRLLIGLPGLNIIQGEPKACKSAFVLNVILENALKGVPSILYDFENGFNRTRLRALSYISGLTIGAIRSQNLDKEEKEQYAKAREVLQTLPIYYEGSIKAQEEIETAISTIGKNHKSHVIVTVDSLQRLPLIGLDKRTSINEWLSQFNHLKKKYEGWVTFLVTSEKNRASYGAGSRSGGKESGEIEYLGELVLDLYPEKDNSAINVECTYARDSDIGHITKLIKPNPFNFRLNRSEFLNESEV